MKHRRAFLGSAVGAITLIAGCSSNSGDATDTQTPEIETLGSTDTEESEDSADQPERRVTTTQGQEESTPEPSVEFNAMLNGVSQCGLTCREIEYTIQNRGQRSATQVTVSIQVTTGGEQVYSQTQSIGSVESQTQKSGITHQIDAGMGGGNKIQSNDGDVTIRLMPEAGDSTSSEFIFERTLDV